MLLPLDLPVLLRLAPRRVRVVLRLLLAGPRPSSSKVRRLLSSAAAALAHRRRSSRTIGLLRRRADHAVAFAAGRRLLEATTSFALLLATPALQSIAVTALLPHPAVCAARFFVHVPRVQL